MPRKKKTVAKKKTVRTKKTGAVAKKNIQTVTTLDYSGEEQALHSFYDTPENYTGQDIYDKKNYDSHNEDEQRIFTYNVDDEYETRDNEEYAEDPFAASEYDVHEDGTTPDKKHTNYHRIHGLFIVNIFHIIFWPIEKIIKNIYWPIKMKRLDNGKDYYEKVYGPTEDEQDEDIFSPPKYFDVFGLRIPKNWPKIITVFVVVSVFLIVPIKFARYYQNLTRVKSSIVADSTNALQALQKGQAAISSLQWEDAEENFKVARENFEKSQETFEQLNFLTRNIILSFPKERKQIKTGLSLLSVGEGLAEVGQNISLSINYLLENDINSEDGKTGILERLSYLKNSIDLVLPKVALAESNLQEVDPEVFSENSIDISATQQLLPTIKNSLRDFSILISGLLKTLGHPNWQRYLLMFQNNNELRPTGGFMGSYALLDVEDGKIKNLEIPSGGTYDLQGSQQALVASPGPLHLVNPIWEFQDSNWWPDFPTSAQKIVWFYENAKGPSVDGVIAVTATIMERLLAITGPIDMPEYGRVINIDNFVFETQSIVENEYDKVENRPKQFISDLTLKMIEEMQNLNSEKIAELGQILYVGLKEKHILLYSTDHQIQNILSDLEWDGKIKPSPEGSDFLHVVYTNIGGEKTDQSIDNNILYTVEIDDQGRAVGTLKITRTHTGEYGEEFTGYKNFNYVRLYVPAGSKLLASSGFDQIELDEFLPTPDGYVVDQDLIRVEGEHLLDSSTGLEIYSELDKTVFAGWSVISPGEEKSFFVKYELPFTITSNNAYTLLVQKQHGSVDTQFTQEVYFPDNFQIDIMYPKSENKIFKGNFISFADVLTTDKFYGFILE